MEFEKDLHLACDLVRRYVKAYGDLVLEHLQGRDVCNGLTVSHLFPSRPG